MIHQEEILGKTQRKSVSLLALEHLRIPPEELDKVAVEREYQYLSPTAP